MVLKKFILAYFSFNGLNEQKKTSFFEGISLWEGVVVLKGPSFVVVGEGTS